MLYCPAGKLLLVLSRRKLLLSNLEYFPVQKVVNNPSWVRSEGIWHQDSVIICDLQGETQERLMHGK